MPSTEMLTASVWKTIYNRNRTPVLTVSQTNVPYTHQDLLGFDSQLYTFTTRVIKRSDNVGGGYLRQ